MDDTMQEATNYWLTLDNSGLKLWPGDIDEPEFRDSKFCAIEDPVLTVKGEDNIDGFLDMVDLDLDWDECVLIQTHTVDLTEVSSYID